MSEQPAGQLDWLLSGAGLADGAAKLAAVAFDPMYREAWSREQIESILKLDSGWINIGLDSSGELRAFALNRQILDEVELLLFAVHPNLRQRGIGSGLLREVKETCLQRGARRIFLEVRRTNDSAQALYRKSGFQPCGVRPSYYCSSDGSLVDAITLEYILI